MKNLLCEDTIESLKAYIKRYPNEERVRGLLSDVESNSSMLGRENVSGHLTASGLVVHDDKLLLIFHKKLQKYLQPGGHLEDDKSLVEAAQREVAEETGLKTTPFKLDNDDVVVPLHIDIHTIPYNEKKNEVEHFHYDCMFLLKTDNSKVDMHESEIEDYKWFSLDYGFNDIGIIEAVEKIKCLVQ